jgi:hypothetical protein
MNDEPTPFQSYDCSLGTVDEHYFDALGEAYGIVRPDGQKVGILANGVASPENVEADIASPRQLPAPVPQEISRPRFMIGLRKVLGLTEGAVFALISQIEDEDTQEDVRDWFEHGVTFARDDHWLNLMAQAQGVTDAQLDQVFIVGASA